jgi:hypothetical protein
LDVYSLPGNGQIQYLIESPCATVQSGVVVPKPHTVNPCNVISSTTGSDNKGISVLFSVDSSGCAAPDALGATNLQLAPIIGGTVAGVVVICVVVAAIIVIVLRRRERQESAEVKRRIENADSNNSYKVAPPARQPISSPPVAPSAQPTSYWSAESPAETEQPSQEQQYHEHQGEPEWTQEQIDQYWAQQQQQQAYSQQQHSHQY